MSPFKFRRCLLSTHLLILSCAQCAAQPVANGLVRAASTLLPKPGVTHPQIPGYFEPNVGQTHESVQFLSRGVYIASDKAAIQADDVKPGVMTLEGAHNAARA